MAKKKTPDHCPVNSPDNMWVCELEPNHEGQHGAFVNLPNQIPIYWGNPVPTTMQALSLAKEALISRGNVAEAIVITELMKSLKDFKEIL